MALLEDDFSLLEDDFSLLLAQIVSACRRLSLSTPGPCPAWFLFLLLSLLQSCTCCQP